ncbi:hypothetical protein JCM10212_004382 [Sporobolomyces blumeae]
MPDGHTSPTTSRPALSRRADEGAGDRGGLSAADHLDSRQDPRSSGSSEARQEDLARGTSRQRGQPLPATTSASPFASTSKSSLACAAPLASTSARFQPPPTRSANAANAIRPPRPYQSPARAILSSTPTPTCEHTLLRLLRRIKSVYPSTTASYLCAIHSNPLFAGYTSPKTYSWILDILFSESNLRGVEAVVEEMKRNEVGWSAELGRILLKGYRRVGKWDMADEVLAKMQEDHRRRRRAGVDEADRQGRVKSEDEELEDLEWVVAGRSTTRLDRGSKGKGKMQEAIYDPATVVGGEGLPWKGWSARNRDIAAFEAGEKTRQQYEQALRGGPGDARKHRAGGGRKRVAGPSICSRPPLARVMIPSNSHELSASSVANLCHLLVQDGRAADAFSVAELWLVERRPRTPRGDRPSPAAMRLAILYNSTLVVLLNLLLKPLLLARLPMPELLRFQTTFLDRHAPPSSLPRPRPSLVTLRQVLSAVTGKTNSWKTSRRVVDHFGYTWGFPRGDGGFEGDERILFVAPTEPAVRKYLCLDPRTGVDSDAYSGEPTNLSPTSAVSSGSSISDTTATSWDRPSAAPTPSNGRPPRLSVKPHSVPPVSVVPLMFAHALETYTSALFPPTSSSGARPSATVTFTIVDIVGFRKWWKGIEYDRREVPRAARVKVDAMVRKARKLGLLE